MKKLMIAAAIVCAAAFAQASTASWSLGGDIETGYSGSENWTYGNAWIIALASNDLTGLGVDTEGNVVLGTGMSINKSAPSYISDGTLSQINSIVNEDGFYALLLADKTTYQWTAIAKEVTGSQAGKDTHQLPVSFGSSGAALTNDPIAVPEPTSGLLLLLGVAGLALRRRRA